MSDEPPKVKYIPFAGGLDTETAAIALQPGCVIGSSNYEASLIGGYERTPGFERFDGRPAPSAADPTILTGTFTAAAGDVLTGVTSGATGTVALAEPGVLVLARVTGAFVAGEALIAGSGGAGVVASNAASVSALDANRFIAAAGNVYRADIAPVPGSGPVRGVASLDDTVYAWRDNVAGTAQAIYKSTPAGWVLVPLLHEIAFTAGGVEPVEGATIVRGGVSAVVRRVVRQSGEWNTASAAGRLIIEAPTGGSFTAGALTSGGTLTLGGAQTPIALAPGGTWQWRVYNFSGGAATLRLYGVDGKNRPAEFDGEVLVPLETGLSGVYPTCIEAHKNHLFVGVGASVMNSGVGDPYDWSIGAGAMEVAVGDNVTGLLSVAGSASEAAMLVACADRMRVLYGNDASDFELVPYSSDVGARAFTLQQLGAALAVDADGVREFTPSQAFGNFRHQTLTAHLQRKAAGIDPIASLVDRQRSRYRVFLSDKRVLSGTPGKRWSWLWSDWPVQVRVAHEGEIDGQARMFVGCDDGFVYEIRDCRSFDGAPIEHWVKLAFSHMGSPGLRKAFRSFAVEMRAKSAGAISFQAEFGYGSSDLDPGAAAAAETPAPPTQWDVDAWDSGVWDGQFARTVRFRTPGVAENASMAFHGLSDNELPATLTGANVTFIPRRFER